MKEKCKNCMRPSKACIAYIMTISTRETLEWCRMWKDRFGWSNAVMAEKSNVPVGTINRIFSHSKTEDDAAGIKLATIRPIICCLTGCTMEELESCEGQADLVAAHADDRLKIDYLKEQIKFKENQMAVKDNLISEYNNHIKRKNRVIRWLAILLGISVFIILTLLVIDAMNPNVGFFWRDVSAYFDGSRTNGIIEQIIEWRV